ncbi:hypothetical protein [Helicobacter acinonychis]|uniref:Uncharacterized protein n=1 Tax=Helicobacter acinonychis (strain Sheeba) TaxID=382638 RepID=Q17VJ6_HELAH|nr:hypothetical protein [Helicobacter acinonychis]CAK00330.1 hypothetical protein Hac_1622 [Helicobacter acinonychis str. Sheeba]
MKQKVHSVSYLAKAAFALKNGVYDLVALPSGAEVVKVSLEIVGSLTAGSVSVGFKDEKEKNYFLLLDKIETNKNATSAKDYSAKDNKVVVAEVKSVAGNEAQGILRVLYFLPSVVEVEY